MHPRSLRSTNLYLSPNSQRELSRQFQTASVPHLSPASSVLPKSPPCTHRQIGDLPRLRALSIPPFGKSPEDHHPIVVSPSPTRTCSAVPHTTVHVHLTHPRRSPHPSPNLVFLLRDAMSPLPPREVSVERGNPSQRCASIQSIQRSFFGTPPASVRSSPMIRGISAISDTKYQLH